MDTYEVKRERRRVGLKRRIIGALCFGAFFSLYLLGWSMLSRTAYERNRGLPSVALELLITSLIAALIQFLFRPTGPLPSYKLLVDDESITGVTERTGWMRWFVHRSTVRKSRVRTIFEIKPTKFHHGGLGVSERSMFGARMLGWVFLPKELPEYDHLRVLVEGWRSAEFPPPTRRAGGD